MKAGASVAAERRVRGLWRQLARRLLDEYAMIWEQRVDLGQGRKGGNLLATGQQGWCLRWSLVVTPLILSTDAAVIGKPLETGGEMVVAAVELEPGAALDEDALRDHCREHLAGYKVPRRVVAIPDLPRSLLGKILRKQVREQVLPQL
jgi:hypothetical protein